MFDTDRCQGTCSPNSLYVGGCQNYGPFSGTLNIRCLNLKPL